MKKILMLAAAVAAFTSCSDNDTEPTPETLMQLQRTEKFVPSLALYDSGDPASYKRVQYYEGNHVVADTTYAPGDFVRGGVSHTYTANTYTRHYSGNGQYDRAFKYTFDAQGRLTHVLNLGTYPVLENPPPNYIYNPDGTIDYYDIDILTGASYYRHTYFTNSSGFITGSWHTNTSTSNYSYNGNKFTSYTYYDGYNPATTTNYTYYDVQVPSNMQRSAIEINNAFFMYDAIPADMSNNLAYYSNAYLQSYQGLLTFDKTFNDAGYLTYDKVTGTLYNVPHDSETFYYYN